MSLDFLRAVVKTEGQALTALYKDVKGMEKWPDGTYFLKYVCYFALKDKYPFTVFYA